VIGEVADPVRFRATLGHLLEDPDAGVRRAALSAAARARDAHHWPAVIGALHDRRVAGAAENALAAAGGGALPAVKVALADPDPALVRRLVRVLGRLEGAEAQELVRQALAHESPLVRDEALATLERCGFHAGDGAREEVADLLWSSLADAAHKLHVIEDMAFEPDADRLRDALRLEVRAAGSRALRILALLHDRAVITRARDNLQSAQREKRAYALELLEVTLAPWRLVYPLLATPPDPEGHLRAEFPEASRTALERVLELLAGSALWLRAWTQACAAEVAVRFGLPRVDDTLRRIRDGRREDDFLGQTITGTLQRRADVAAGGRTTMLAIEKVVILKSVHMFAEVSEDVLADVAALVEEVDAPAEHVIVRQGEPGDCMYIIVEGRVRVYESDVTIVELGDRDIFGELALLDPEPRMASVAALVPTRLFSLDREAFLELMTGSPEIVRGVLHVLCERLRQTARQRTTAARKG
jgi:CRP-like cAMP-binding protein/HEAT repeat protein